MGVLAPRSGAGLGQLGRAGIGVCGQVRRDRGGLAFLGLLGLPALDQELPAGPDAFLVQALDNIRVHRSVKPECRSAFPGPFSGRLSGRGVVGHGPGAATAALAMGEVGHVVASVQGDVS